MIRPLLALLLLVAASSEGTTTVFVDVNLIPMTANTVVADQDVLIQGERIIAIGKDITLPEGTRVINGKGKYLMPGLAEMHGHTPVPEGNPDTDFVRDMMFLYVANGVTTVRGMLGAAGQLQLREMAQEKQVLGPTLYLAGPSFSGNSISSAAEAELRVRQQVGEGWNLLKVHPGLSRDEFDAMATTASKLGIRFGGHVPQEVGLMHAIRMGQHTFDHIDGYIQHLGFPQKPMDNSELNDIVRISRDAGVWIVPTLVLWDHVIGLGDADASMQWPELNYWPKTEVNRWYTALKNSSGRSPQAMLQAYSDARNQILKALSDGGVGILMGTDSPQIFSVPGFSIHREMAAMSKAGMSNYEVLASGTRNVGIYLQGEDAFGVIAPGQRADLILANGNPLENLAAVADRAGVMIRGQWLAESEIQSRLSEILKRQQ